MTTYIKKLRINNGLTLEEVAKDVGTDPGNLSRIERGMQFPRRDLCLRLAEMYQVKPERIMFPK